MALLAADTKLPLMHVFGLMTRHTIAAHRGGIFALGCFVLMAAHTSYFAMRTVEHVFGSLVMVKVPQTPGTGVVTALAAHA